MLMKESTRTGRRPARRWLLGLLATSTTAAMLVYGPAGPASATVEYGVLQSNSYCPSYGAAVRCYVYLKWGSTTTLTRPQASGSVYCPGNPADGLSVYSAIGSRSLVGKYVGVLWGSGTEAINCH
jgi:hypothetical protein